MRKLIVAVTLATAPLVAAAPAPATAGHRVAVGGDAAVVTAGLARDGLAHPPSAPPAPQARDAATPRQSDETKSPGETAVLPRHHHAAAETASAHAGTPAASAAQTLAGSASARAPPCLGPLAGAPLPTCTVGEYYEGTTLGQEGK